MGNRAVTKILTILVLLFSLVLTGCMKEEDYYTKEEVEAKIKEATEANQTQRFLMTILEKQLDMEGIQFANIGDTAEGIVEDWSYSYVIIELDRNATVQLSFTSVAPDGEWDLNIYLDNISEPHMTFEEITLKTYVIYLMPGFNVIEIDSYSNSYYRYRFTITELA